MIKNRKVTILLKGDLLDKALASSGKNITQTIEQGLEMVAATQVYDQLKKLRGKVKFSIDINKLRQD